MLANDVRFLAQKLDITCQQLRLVLFTEHLRRLGMMTGNGIRAKLGEQDGLTEFFVKHIQFGGEQGQGFVYSWTASAPVHFEMHSVPDAAPSTFAETFEKLDDRPAGHGSYTAPFSGIHGWYWQNRTKEPVTLTFAAAGFFSNSQEFRRGAPPKVKSF